MESKTTGSPARPPVDADGWPAPRRRFGRDRPGRRRLLRGAVGLLSPLPAAIAGAGRPAAAAPVRIAALAFGTRVHVTVAGLDPQRAHDAARAAMDEILRIDRLTALQRSGSALARLNAAGRLDAPDPLLLDLLLHARAWSERTGGAFDASVQPLWTWHAGRVARPSPDGAGPDEPVPDDRAVRRRAREQAQALVDHRRIDPTADRIRLLRAGMALTLNGIAQGYAADRALARLRALGADQALVDAGEFAGTRHAGAPWRIAIREPAPFAAAPLATVELADAAIASSSDEAWRFTADGDLHHIFDPATGWSPPELAGVTVIAPDATTADALSTACMVLGSRRSRTLVETLPGCAALLIARDGARTTTSRWPGGPAFPGGPT